MPEIISAGQLPGNKRYEATCSNCRTRFSFLQKEAQHGYDRNDSYLSIRCPLAGCGHMVNVSTSTSAGSSWYADR
ncbi:hypothetical protein BcepSauron_364 [Burkholderia phage BcepSauron]|uniref:Uncharacterized protein n=2 Tax=Sarumanvirus TaxID=2843450 RepID=A0A482MLX2_9CAUD|nr:hypothetical protein H1O16_gp361 [Burkholderia phage BcepSaruman]YP_009904742.1 hypothetical protein H1O17_gp364 [Burkholderia phage BcepSauron]QBQ74744.1 hypothetical protein BcepSauron_364 [Burkholderia phage BcepSauron]QBX06774.1 hypothetical protein BcepSaruman_361 [Burkholderia phage BcepSaruman]